MTPEEQKLNLTSGLDIHAYTCTHTNTVSKKIPRSTHIVLVGVYCDEPCARMDTLWQRNSSTLSHITIRQWTKYVQTWARFLRMTVFTVKPKPKPTKPTEQAL